MIDTIEKRIKVNKGGKCRERVKEIKKKANITKVIRQQNESNGS